MFTAVQNFSVEYIEFDVLLIKCNFIESHKISFNNSFENKTEFNVFLTCGKKCNFDNKTLKNIKT